jgi:hypothetical protein
VRIGTVTLATVLGIHVACDAGGQTGAGTACTRAVTGRSGTLVGEVVGDSGQPVVGADVAFGSYRATTDRNGRVVIAGVQPGTHQLVVVPPREVLLVGDVLVEPPRSARATLLTVTAGRTTRFRRILQKGGRIETTIRRGGSPLAKPNYGRWVRTS